MRALAWLCHQLQRGMWHLWMWALMLESWVEGFESDPEEEDW